MAALVSVAELGQTSLYPEIIERITRGSTENAELHILDAESLVRSYLSKYDTDAIWGIDPDPPTFTGGDVNLIKKMIKIIASYFLVRLANPNVNLEIYRADYKDVMKWLEKLQDGLVNPDLPYKPDNPDTPEDESNPSVSSSSNPKRENFF